MPTRLFWLAGLLLALFHALRCLRTFLEMEIDVQREEGADY